MPLNEVGEGESAEVVKFTDTANQRKFLSLGILPGTVIQIVRRWPAVVLRVGYSEFAFDHALAATVVVRRLDRG